VKLFRVTVSTDRTDYIVTNDLSQNSTDEVQEANAVRWKVEEFHRGVKQLTGIEACQCRKENSTQSYCLRDFGLTGLKKTIYPDLSNHLSIEIPMAF